MKTNLCKRWLCLLLALVLVTGVLPVTGAAAQEGPPEDPANLLNPAWRPDVHQKNRWLKQSREIAEEYKDIFHQDCATYEEIQTAMSQCYQRPTFITVTADIDYNGRKNGDMLKVREGLVILDLNGHHIHRNNLNSMDASMFSVWYGGKLIVIDTVGTGLVTFLGHRGSQATFWVENSYLEIYGGTYTADSNTAMDSFLRVFIAMHGDIQIYGGEFICLPLAGMHTGQIFNVFSHQLDATGKSRLITYDGVFHASSSDDVTSHSGAPEGNYSSIIIAGGKHYFYPSVDRKGNPVREETVWAGATLGDHCFAKLYDGLYMPDTSGNPWGMDNYLVSSKTVKTESELGTLGEWGYNHWKLDGQPLIVSKTPGLTGADRMEHLFDREFWDQMYGWDESVGANPNDGICETTVYGRTLPAPLQVGFDRDYEVLHATWQMSSDGRHYTDMQGSSGTASFDPPAVDSSCKRYYRLNCELRDGRHFSDTVLVGYDFSAVPEVNVWFLGEPTHGKPAGYVATTLQNDCKVTEVKYVLFHKEIPNYVPQYGDQVKIGLYITCTGERFPTMNTRISWNGLETTPIRVDGNKLIAVFDWTVGIDPENIIHQLDLRVPEPKIGRKPGKPQLKQQDSCTIKKSEWRDSANGTLLDPTTATFQEGKQYTLTVKLEADPEKIFADDLTVLINDRVAEFEHRTHGSAANRGYFATVTFPEPEGPCDGGSSCPSRDFTDVPAVGSSQGWAHEGIDYVLENGLFLGRSQTEFAPWDPMDRSMLVTVLWRYAGKPQGGATEFPDVPPRPDMQWCVEPISWAAYNKIVLGYPDGTFGPLKEISRQDLMTILYRFAKDYMHQNTTILANLSRFPDADKISDYAKYPIAWGVYEGLLSGRAIDGKIYLDPQGNASRAQVATIIMRFAEKFSSVYN